jgi:hypothetical protein
VQAYLEAMTRMFGACTQRTIDKFSAATEGGKVSVTGKATGLSRRFMQKSCCVHELAVAHATLSMLCASRNCTLAHRR